MSINFFSHLMIQLISIICQLNSSGKNVLHLDILLIILNLLNRSFITPYSYLILRRSTSWLESSHLRLIFLIIWIKILIRHSSCNLLNSFNLVTSFWWIWSSTTSDTLIEWSITSIQGAYTSATSCSESWVQLFKSLFQKSLDFAINIFSEKSPNIFFKYFVGFSKNS